MAWFFVFFFLLSDNASYHSRKTTDAPNSKTKVADLRSWIKKNSSADPSKLKRPECWAMVKNLLKTKPAEKAVDAMVQRAGIVLERLPPYHCDLNPIERC